MIFVVLPKNFSPMLNIREFTIINLCNWILLITFAQKFNYSLLIMAEKKTKEVFVLT